MVYLDNAATTYPVFYPTAFDNYWGNPNSPHHLGIQSDLFLEQCRKDISLGSGKVVFGGNATRLVDILCRRLFQNCSKSNTKIYVSPYEHHCISSRVHSSKNNNCDIPDSQTEICFHMLVNNITGEHYRKEIEVIRNESPDTYIVCDCTAAIGHVELTGLTKIVDCIICSAHKFYGPQGTGFMWISDRFAKSKYLKLSESSKNEYGLIDGTPAVCNIQAMMRAFKLVSEKNYHDIFDNLYVQLITSFRQYDIDFEILKSENEKTKAINAIWIKDVNADALVQYLSSKEIYVSPLHSACSDESDFTQAVNSGIDKEIAKQSIRVSFSLDNTIEDIGLLAFFISRYIDTFLLAC